MTDLPRHAARDAAPRPRHRARRRPALRLRRQRARRGRTDDVLRALRAAADRARLVRDHALRPEGRRLRALRASPPRPVRRGAGRAPLRLPPPARERCLTLATDAPIATTPAGEMKQPRGIYLLFAVEMWERFSYYGMRALLVLYLVDAQHGGMGWIEAPAQRLYGWYGFFAYVLPVLGGAAADRWLGTRRAHIDRRPDHRGGPLLPRDADRGRRSSPAWCWSSSGRASSRPTCRRWSGQLYRERDPRRDPGFTIYYMGVNTGRAAGAARVRLPGGEPALGLALGLRRRRRGDGAGSRRSTWRSGIATCPASAWRPPGSHPGRARRSRTRGSRARSATASSRCW